MQEQYSQILNAPQGTREAYGQTVNPTGHQARVLMMLFSPHLQSDQVLRPLTYQFDGNFTDYLWNNRDRMGESVGRDPFAMKHDFIRNAVTPDSNGIQCQMGQMSTKWSFVMYIDIPMRHNTMRRFMGAGYFRDEPVAPNTVGNTSPAYNPRARLIFTEFNCLHQSTRHGTAGPIHDLNFFDAADLVNTDTMHLASEDVNIMLPSSLANPAISKNNINGNQPSVMAISNLSTLDGETSRIPPSEKSPLSHLRKVVSSIERGLEFKNTDTPGTYNSRNETEQDSFALAACSRLVEGTDSSVINSSFIDISREWIFGELDTMFPNMIVQPMMLPYNPSWETRPQDQLTKQNIYSYTAVQVVSSAAVQTNIATISFRYNSWMKGPGEVSMGVWQIFDAAMITKTDDNQAETSIKQFRGWLEYDLFPVILANAGHFDLMMRYDFVGKILVELRLYDYTEFNEGVFETTGVFGSVSNPILGTDRNTLSNYNELNTLMEHICNKDDFRTLSMDSNEMLIDRASGPALPGIDGPEMDNVYPGQEYDQLIEKPQYGANNQEDRLIEGPNQQNNHGMTRLVMP